MVLVDSDGAGDNNGDDNKNNYNNRCDRCVSNWKYLSATMVVLMI